MFIDLHVQSRYSSQGSLEPEEIMLRAKSVGLDGVCLTEDRPLRDWAELQKLAQIHEFQLFGGRLIISDHGHLLFYPQNIEDLIDEHIFPYNQDGQPIAFTELVQKAKQLKGILASAHPYHLNIQHPMGDRLFQVKGIDALEVRNAQFSELINDFALEASYHLKLQGIAGSGTRDNLNTLGKVATLFRQKITSQHELIEAIRAGEIWPTLIGSKSEIKSKVSNEHRDRRERFDDRRNQRRPLRDNERGTQINR